MLRAFAQNTQHREVQKNFFRCSVHALKHVDEFTEEGDVEGETIIHKRERFSHELTLAYADGTIVELKTTKEGGQEN